MTLKCMGFLLKTAWIMEYRRGYGFFKNFSANEHGGPKKVWTITAYGI